MRRAPLQDTAAYRAVGGDIVGPAGWVEPEAARRLIVRYGREAERCHGRDQREAALLCMKVALDLARALVASSDWRCAAAGAKRSHAAHFSLHELLSDVKTERYS